MFLLPLSWGQNEEKKKFDRKGNKILLLDLIRLSCLLFNYEMSSGKIMQISCRSIFVADTEHISVRLTCLSIINYYLISCVYNSYACYYGLLGERIVNSEI
jgi:hypothetical protein